MAASTPVSCRNRHDAEKVGTLSSSLLLSESRSSNPIHSQKTFADLDLTPPVHRALAENGYERPTPIQAAAIPPALAGRDVLGCAQTGTGKTAAFALPILHRLMTDPVPAHAAKGHRGPKRARALVLSPTRELATQIAESFRTYGRYTGLTGAVIFGGVSQRRQEQSLARGVDIIVATPGRLLDLTEQGLIDYTSIGMFVLDEADRMLDMGFIAPIREITAAIPEQRQTLLFSATMPPAIKKLADTLLTDPVHVKVTPVASTAVKIEQRVYHVPQGGKQGLLEELVNTLAVTRAIVFTKTKRGADLVCRRLTDAGITAAAIHGNKNQNQRDRCLHAFRAGRHRVLVATDVAARGLDIDGVSHVFNYDLPMEPESYVHRIGRTARAGAAGTAIAFCDPSERRLLRSIEKTIKASIAVVNDQHAPAARHEPGADQGRGPAHHQRGGRQSAPRSNARTSEKPPRKNAAGMREEHPRQGSSPAHARSSPAHARPHPRFARPSRPSKSR